MYRKQPGGVNCVWLLPPRPAQVIWPWVCTAQRCLRGVGWEYDGECRMTSGSQVQDATRSGDEAMKGLVDGGAAGLLLLVAISARGEEPQPEEPQPSRSPRRRSPRRHSPRRHSRHCSKSCW